MTEVGMSQKLQTVILSINEWLTLGGRVSCYNLCNKSNILTANWQSIRIIPINCSKKKAFPLSFDQF